jgi:hypothetical protein
VTDTVISTVMTTPGVFEIRADGAAVGMFSIIDNIPATGRALFPSVAAGHIAAALTDLYRAVGDTDMQFRARGWSSEAAYHAQVDATRSVTSELPAPLRAEVATAFARHGWDHPLTPEQMSAWQDEVLDIIIDATTPATVDDSIERQVA